MERIAGRISKPPIPVAVIFHGKSATERPLAIAPSLKLQHPISYATIQTHIKSYSLYLNNTKPKHSLLLHYIFSLSFSFSLSPTFSPTTFFIAVSHRPIPDLDCKLKSAAQTPAAMHNNLHNNVPEILGRSSVNSSQMYYKTVSAHFASCIIILIFKIVSQSLRSEFRLILWILYGALSAHSRTFLYSVLTLFALSLILTVGRSMVRWTLNTPYKHTYFRVYFVYARFTMLFFFLHEMYTRENSQGKASDCGREYEREWSEKRKGTMWK